MTAKLVDAKTDALLQTADCIISHPSETKSLKVKVLLDPGSQKTYLSVTVRNFLQLDTISKQNVQIKAFGEAKGQLKELGEFKFVLRNWNGDGFRYVVKLPFKENILFVSDNYNFSLSGLRKLRIRLSKRTDTFAKYDKVITDQLEHGFIEKVESIGIRGKVKYLPHQAVIRDDHSSTKLRLVFDASSKTIGPSLNDTLYKGTCLTPLMCYYV